MTKEINLKTNKYKWKILVLFVNTFEGYTNQNLDKNTMRTRDVTLQTALELSGFYMCDYSVV